MSEPDTNKRGPSVISKLREVASFILSGSVIAGAFFSWLHTSVDIHAIGAGIGALGWILYALKSSQD